MSRGEKKARLAGHADTSGCIGCMYHNADGRGGSCNYCYITGHMRGSPVEECTKKEIGPTARLSGDFVLDGSPVTGVAGRTDRGTAPNKNHAQTLQPWEQPPIGRPTFSRASAWSLYQEGESDARIAAALDCGETSVRRWRKKHGLESNY